MEPQESFQPAYPTPHSGAREPLGPLLDLALTPWYAFRCHPAYYFFCPSEFAFACAKGLKAILARSLPAACCGTQNPFRLHCSLALVPLSTAAIFTTRFQESAQLPVLPASHAQGILPISQVTGPQDTSLPACCGIHSPIFPHAASLATTS